MAQLRKLFLVVSLGFGCLFATEWDCYRESEHFAFKHMAQDEAAAKVLLEIAEESYVKLCKEFNHTPEAKLDVEIYPSIAEFHSTIELEDGPLWAVGGNNSKTGAIAIVSPLNPGPEHSEKSLKQVFFINVVKGLIRDKFKEANVPFWLQTGAGFFKTDANHRKLPDTLPGWEQLECKDCKEFAEVGGFQSAHSLVAFIEKGYGWDKLLELMGDYESFEKILGISKKELHENWTNYIWLKKISIDNIDIESLKLLKSFSPKRPAFKLPGSQLEQKKYYTKRSRSVYLDEEAGLVYKIWNADYPAVPKFLMGLHRGFYKDISNVSALIMDKRGNCRGYVSPKLISREFDRAEWEAYDFCLKKNASGVKIFSARETQPENYEDFFKLLVDKCKKTGLMSTDFCPENVCVEEASGRLYLVDLEDIEYLTALDSNSGLIKGLLEYNPTDYLTELRQTRRSFVGNLYHSLKQKISQ